jgi:hypothetical protein
VERLEDRHLLSFTNVVVNDTALDTTSRDTQSETALVLGANGAIIAAYNDSAISALEQDHTLGYSRSTDGGATFTEGSLPVGGLGTRVDPVLARDNSTGTIYLASLSTTNAAAISVFRSTDNGATFSGPVNGAPGLDSTHVLDKDWLAVDNSTAPGSGQGNVYLVFQDNVDSSNAIYITRSTDGGATWSSEHFLNAASQGAYVTVGPDHTVYVFFYDASDAPRTIRMMKSTDQGITFSTPVLVTTVSTGGEDGDLDLTVSNTDPTSIRSNTFPQAVVTATGIYVAYDDVGTVTGDRADVFLSASGDGGNTWTRMRVNDDSTTTDQWQPALAATPDGTTLGVFWYDRRGDSNNGLIDRYGAIATVAGGTVSFGPNFRISDTSFPAVVHQDPGVKGDYMGDYDTAVADANAFCITWGDNRLADTAHANQPDVRFATIPVDVNPVPVITSLSSTSVVEGASGFTLTVTGSGFVATSVVRWGTTPLVTTFIDAEHLTAAVPASLLAEEGNSTVTVFNIPLGGGTSNGVTFTVQDAGLTAAASTISATQNRSFSATVATFSDAYLGAPVGDFTATIDWGDGQTSSGVVQAAGTPGNFVVSGAHLYLSEGRFNITVSIVDQGGSQASAASLAHVARTSAPPDCLITAAEQFTHSPEYFNHFVTQEYVSLLNRAPDPAGLAGWTQAMLGGLRDEQLEAAFVTSTEYVGLHGGIGSSWIQALYHDLLGRSPSNAEIQGWLQMLNNGTTPATVAALFTTSLEHAVRRVIANYTTYLGRTPSQNEANAWAFALANRTLSNEDVIAQFLASGEYFSHRFGNVPDWIYAAYGDLFSRIPDPTGFAQWFNFLENC